jgi:hypothetical protein
MSRGLSAAEQGHDAGVEALARGARAGHGAIRDWRRPVQVTGDAPTVDAASGAYTCGWPEVDAAGGARASWRGVQ